MHDDSLSDDLAWWTSQTVWHVLAFMLMWRQVTQIMSIRVWLKWFGHEMSFRKENTKNDVNDDPKRSSSLIKKDNKNSASAAAGATCCKSIGLYWARGWNKVEFIGTILHIFCVTFQVLHFSTHSANRNIKFPNSKSSFEDGVNFNIEVLGPFYNGYNWFAISLYITALHYSWLSVRFFHYIAWHKGMKVLNTTLHLAIDMVWNVVLVMVRIFFVVSFPISHVHLIFFICFFCVGCRHNYKLTALLLLLIRTRTSADVDAFSHGHDYAHLARRNWRA